MILFINRLLVFFFILFGSLACNSGSSSSANPLHLISLSISSGTLTPGFSADVTAYAVTVANTVPSITVTPTLRKSSSIAEVNLNGNDYVRVTSGEASGDLALNLGDNTVNVRVTAADESTRVYALTITRTASADASLSALTVESTSNALTLYPIFSAGETDYGALRETGLGLYVTPTATDPNATVEVRSDLTAYAPIESGDRSSLFSSHHGENMIDVRVTAQDGTTSQVYSISVYSEFAYVLENGSNGISVCALEADRSFGSCSATGSGFNAPYGIDINPGRTLAYVSNGGNNTISYCAIQSDSTLAACVTTGTSLNTPVAVAIDPANAFAYAINNNDNTATYCAIDVSGSFSACQSTAPFFDGPFKIVLNSEGALAYVTNQNTNTVSMCAIDSSTGALSACADAGGNGFNAPSGLRLNPLGSFAYITNNGDNTVTYCPVNSNGSFGTCASTAAVFDVPGDIAFDALGTMAYVVNLSDNTVSSCAVGADGNLNSCQTTATGFNGPSGIILR